MIPSKMAEPFCLAAWRTKSDTLLVERVVPNGLESALRFLFEQLYVGLRRAAFEFERHAHADQTAADNRVFQPRVKGGSNDTDFTSASTASSCSGVPVAASQTLPSAPPTPPPATNSALAPVS